jgi:hypothetical protein
MQDANAPAPSKSAAAKITNNSLPKEVMEGKTWSNVIIPTMIRWAGCQDSAWNFSEDDFLEALRVTCQHYIDRIEPESFSLESAAYKLVSADLFFDPPLLTSNVGNPTTHRPLAKRYRVICHDNHSLLLRQRAAASN